MKKYILALILSLICITTFAQNFSFRYGENGFGFQYNERSTHNYWEPMPIYPYYVAPQVIPAYPVYPYYRPKFYHSSYDCYPFKSDKRYHNHGHKH